MPKQKKNDRQKAKKTIKKLKKIEKGYLNIVENTLKTFKEQKRADSHHLDNIEYLLEAYKKELEYIDQKNKEMYDNLIKLIENRASMHDKVKEDLKKSDNHIQLIQRKL